MYKHCPSCLIHNLGVRHASATTKVSVPACSACAVDFYRQKKMFDQSSQQDVISACPIVEILYIYDDYELCSSHYTVLSSLLLLPPP